LAAHTDVREHLNGYAALILAAENGHVDVVKLLLATGADKEARDYSVRYAIGPGAALPLNYGTALIHAAAGGDTDVVKVLLNAGANKKAKDYWGHTALDAAEYNKHADVVKLLLDARTEK
jgi:ankyrin repeat protein